MASLGNLFIAGKDQFNGIYKCGISYELSIESPISLCYQSTQQDWQVEFVEGLSFVVARTTHSLSYEDAQVGGFAAIQEALDIQAVKGSFFAYLSDPARSNTCVYTCGKKIVLCHYNILDAPLNISVELKTLDSSGNEIKSQLPPEPTWNESFRYYRLSQCSNDLFEAYRNLFLSFESLLNAICEKKHSEGEGAWLKRALTVINLRVPLISVTPNGREEPISYIIQSQYKKVRCKLQHAKFPDAKLPHAHPSLQDVRQAYGELAIIWRRIAGEYFNIHIGGGVVTYIGFEKMMASLFTHAPEVYLTSDKTLPTESDTLTSPNNNPCYKMQSSKYMGEINPGLVRIYSSEMLIEKEITCIDKIHRIGTLIQTKMFGISYIEPGITLSGIDKVEYINDIRLINSSQPKTEFNT